MNDWLGAIGAFALILLVATLAVLAVNRLFGSERFPGDW